MHTHYDALVVGAGHGGAQAASSLRQLGFTGTIGMIGDEADPPYERPPLSKDYLKQKKSFDSIMIRPLAFWADRGVDPAPLDQGHLRRSGRAQPAHRRRRRIFLQQADLGGRRCTAQVGLPW